jgi:hypothetical protein
MGREAQGLYIAGAMKEIVQAHLESTVLILRGPALRRRIPLSALTDVLADGRTLRFTVDQEAIAIELDAGEAPKWAKKIATPAPSLASKLGVGVRTPACVIGQVTDAALAEALRDATTDRPDCAAMLVAVVLTEDDLARAVSQHAGLRCSALWAIHLKGKAAPLGDTAIRRYLRERGYIDNKTTAVSQRFTATRYTRR